MKKETNKLKYKVGDKVVHRDYLEGYIVLIIEELVTPYSFSWWGRDRVHVKDCKEDEFLGKA